MCFEAAESGWEQNNVFEIRRGLLAFQKLGHRH